MQELPVFKAFFSYAHHDAETDPTLIAALTNELENRVNAKLANARFAIWRDKDDLRTGDLWNPKIEAEVRGSDVLIVLLTPRWVESEYCRNEYVIFEEVEVAREIGEYVIPLLVRSSEPQQRHFTEEQNSVYERIRARQYRSANAVEFLKLSPPDRIELIDKIADDVAGMIERRRVLPQQFSRTNRPTLRARLPKESDSKAQNYERVDFLTNGEVVLDRPTNEGRRNVLAHVGFLERLYVKGSRGRIEFGVRRAYLSIKAEGPGRLSKVDELKGGDAHKTRYYTTLQDAADAVTVCMDPPVGKTSLSELPLPPARGENLLSRVATTQAEMKADQIKAKLLVSLDAEGLYFADGKFMSPRIEAAIKSIMNVANTKLARGGTQTIDANGLLRRSLLVRERS
jgi:hypothetical protein